MDAAVRARLQSLKAPFVPDLFGVREQRYWPSYAIYTRMGLDLSNVKSFRVQGPDRTCDITADCCEPEFPDQPTTEDESEYDAESRWLWRNPEPSTVCLCYSEDAVHSARILGHQLPQIGTPFGAICFACFPFLLSYLRDLPRQLSPLMVDASDAAPADEPAASQVGAR